MLGASFILKGNTLSKLFINKLLILSFKTLLRLNDACLHLVLSILKESADML